MAIAMLLSVFATRWGPGITADSTAYLSAAESLALSGNLNTWDGTTLTAYPPAYPALVRLLMSSGASSDAAARIVASLCAGLIALLSWRLLRRTTVPIPIALAASGFIALTPVLATTTRMAWSEPLFTVVILLIVLVLDGVRHRDTQISGTEIVTLIVLTWLAVLLRYAGLGLIPGVGITVLLVSGLERRSIRAAAIYTAGSLAVPIAWITRNFAVSGKYGGPQVDPGASFGRDLYSVAATLGRWIIPTSTVPSSVTSVLGLSLVIALTVWFGVHIRQAVAHPADPEGLPLVLLLVGASLVSYILLSARITWVSVDSRMLSPTLPLLIILITVVLQQIGQSSRYRWANSAIAAAVAALAFVGGYHTVDMTRSDFATGVAYTYNDGKWRSSPLIILTSGLSSSSHI